ncbi:hypothetical protein GCM10023205_15260 [Yinghuangia aomiensis]|uniref:Uncharacterized protein n=1 Tax=Yinghuangia aomiensis TaxID=676205 RepID=A0ABP9H2A7_9ACTN
MPSDGNNGSPTPADPASGTVLGGRSIAPLLLPCPGDDVQPAAGTTSNNPAATRAADRRRRDGMQG